VLFAVNKSIGTISDWKKLPKRGTSFVLYTRKYQDSKIKDYEMGKSCSAQGEMRNAHRISLKSLKF
jgi:hypothetical protein